jgi:hypothetical protein
MIADVRPESVELGNVLQRVVVMKSGNHRSWASVFGRRKLAKAVAT